MTFTLEFQNSILKFILQSPDGKKYFSILQKSMFDSVETEVLYDCIVDYYKNYKNLPSKIHFKEYVIRECERNQIDENQTNKLLSLIGELYKPLPVDLEIVKKSIIDFSQQQKIKKVFSEYGKRILSPEAELNPSLFNNLRQELNAIIELPKAVSESEKDNFFVLKNFLDRSFTHTQGYPCKFPTINRCMASGGFKSPELVVFMSSAKAGKTTLLINLAYDYLKKGLKVLYIDLENGHQRIESMIYQCMLKCTYEELTTGYIRRKSKDKNCPNYNDPDTVRRIIELKDRVKESADLDAHKELLTYYYDDLNERGKRYADIITERGGDMKVEFLPAKKANIDDVRAICDRLAMNHGFIPDLVICDYVDKMVSLTKNLETRINIQNVYDEWKAFAAERNVFVLTVSQVKRDAFDKDRFTAKDLAEDIGKAANCDTMFAFVRNETDKSSNAARLMPVLNRNGSDDADSFLTLLHVDIERVQITEMELNAKVI